MNERLSMKRPYLGVVAPQPELLTRSLASFSTRSPILGQINNVAIPAEATAAIADMATSTVMRAGEIIKFSRENRPLATEAGIEVIALELDVIVKTGALDRVQNTVSAASSEGRQAVVSQDDLDSLRRANALVGEAASYLTSRLTIADRVDRASSASETASMLFLLIATMGLVGILAKIDI